MFIKFFELAAMAGLAIMTIGAERLLHNNEGVFASPVKEMRGTLPSNHNTLYFEEKDVSRIVE